MYIYIFFFIESNKYLRYLSLWNSNLLLIKLHTFNSMWSFIWLILKSTQFSDILNQCPGGNISQKWSPIFSFFNFLRNSGKFFRFLQKVLDSLWNYRMRNLIFEEKRRNLIFLKKSEKSLPFSPDISYFLRIRWDWETKNSRKIGEILRLKNSVKNLIFSAKNLYFDRIQRNWEHDNFEKIKGTSKLENFQSPIFVSSTKLLILTTIKHPSRPNSEGKHFFLYIFNDY